MSLASMMDSVATLKRPTIGRDSAMGTTQDPFTVVSFAGVGVTFVVDSNGDYLVDDEGNYVITTSSPVTSVPCSTQPAGATVRMAYAQNHMNVTTRVFFMQSIGARPNDRLEITDRQGNVTKFLVHGNQQQVYRQRVWFVDCEQLD